MPDMDGHQHRDVAINNDYIGPLAIPHPRGKLLEYQVNMLQSMYGLWLLVGPRRSWNGPKETLHGEPAKLKESTQDALELVHFRCEIMDFRMKARRRSMCA